MFTKYTSNTSILLLLFLIILVYCNIIYFYFIISPQNSLIETNSKEISIGHREYDIEKYLRYLAYDYRNRNSKFPALQNQLLKTFNVSKGNKDSSEVWQSVSMWNSNDSLFPNTGDIQGKILQALKNAEIVSVDNSHKGTQLKLLLLLSNSQKLIFKPKRYSLDSIINGNIYAGFDRHNSEVFAYYLAVVLNFTWIAPAVIRKLNVRKEILPFVTDGLKDTIIIKDKVCIYGKCYYCKINETVCEDKSGFIEGAALLYIEKQLKVNKSPWRRSYSSKKMAWEGNDNYCKKVIQALTQQRLLDLIDTSIFDFLIQNGDRHRYEVYKDRIVLLDNGKGLGNPYNDELDILAPLYQCCRLRLSTWHRLELLSGGSLSKLMELLISLQETVIASKFHFEALDRRLLKIYAAVQICIGKHGSASVFY